MYDYPRFDGTQSCQYPSPAAARGFSGATGADPGPALELCARCLFATECRSWALEHDVYGVWGGTTDADRAALRDRDHAPAPASITDALDELVLALRVTSRVVDDDLQLSAS